MTLKPSKDLFMGVWQPILGSLLKHSSTPSEKHYISINIRNICRAVSELLFWIIQLHLSFMTTHLTYFYMWKGTIPAHLSFKYHQTSNISHTLVGNKLVDHSDVVGASPVDLTPGFNGLGKDNFKMRRESFKFCDLVQLILRDFTVGGCHFGQYQRCLTHWPMRDLNEIL